MLEKKEKLESRCHKKTCKITVDEYNTILSGDVTDLIFVTEKSLIKELAVDMLIHPVLMSFHYLMSSPYLRHMFPLLLWDLRSISLIIKTYLP